MLFLLGVYLCTSGMYRCGSWLEHDLPARVPLVSNVPGPMASLLQQLQLEMGICVQCLLSRTWAYNYGYNVYDVGSTMLFWHRGVVGFNAPLVGLGGVYGLRK
ncbi:hypothetical protein CEXT_413531 [Caerostris extrusa]|uniref:Uncharacterized protein n=1 Tax=Caerostris extrusa TaxID=172846 RepID=A0AAV4VBE6_CAEEX|nr:hypothetical protein CEXT_413531 [Caerostris extrusa]